MPCIGLLCKFLSSKWGRIFHFASMKHRSRITLHFPYSLYLIWFTECLRMIVIIEHKSSEFCQLINLVLENVLKLFSMSHQSWWKLDWWAVSWWKVVSCVYVFLWSVSNRKMNPGKRAGGTSVPKKPNKWSQGIRKTLKQDGDGRGQSVVLAIFMEFS